MVYDVLEQRVERLAYLAAAQAERGELSPADGQALHAPTLAAGEDRAEGAAFRQGGEDGVLAVVAQQALIVPLLAQDYLRRGGGGFDAAGGEAERREEAAGRHNTSALLQRRAVMREARIVRQRRECPRRRPGAGGCPAGEEAPVREQIGPVGAR